MEDTQKQKTQTVRPTGLPYDCCIANIAIPVKLEPRESWREQAYLVSRAKTATLRMLHFSNLCEPSLASRSGQYCCSRGEPAISDCVTLTPLLKNFHTLSCSAAFTVPVFSSSATDLNLQSCCADGVYLGSNLTTPTLRYADRQQDTIIVALLRTCSWTCECLSFFACSSRRVWLCNKLRHVALSFHDIDLLCFFGISFALQLRRHAAGLHDAQHAFDAVTRS